MVVRTVQVCKLTKSLNCTLNMSTVLIRELCLSKALRKEEKPLQRLKDPAQERMRSSCSRDLEFAVENGWRRGKELGMVPGNLDGTGPWRRCRAAG